MKRVFVLVLFLSSIITSFSCGNEYGYTLDGKRIYTRYFFISERMSHFDTLEINRRLLLLDGKITNGTANYKTWSNKALNLMKLGRSDSALIILEPLALKYPKEYTILANLGTCYELLGELDSALKYISLGYKIDPTSHRGSEWIHIKILEAKIKEKKYPGWMKTNSILDLKELLNDTTARSLRLQVRRVERSISYQIRTRVPFTPAPNSVLANLTETLGDYNAEIGTYENALLAYSYAVKFQPDHYLKRKLKDKIKSLNKKRGAIEDLEALPDQFIKAIQRAQLNPDLLLMGLDDFAETLDSLHLNGLNKQDSVKVLSTLLDSVETNSANLLVLKNQEVNEAEDAKFVYMIAGIVLGIVLAFLFILVSRKK